MKVLSQQDIFSSMNYSTGSMPPNICAGCSQVIKDKYLLKAVNEVWHEECLKCSCCNCLLGEVGSSLFVRANLLLCKQDYLRLFGTPGSCSACLQPIPPFQLVMRAREHAYHIDCFSCYYCHQRFCVGDKFYLVDKRIMCEKHYMEEDMMNQETASLLNTSSLDHSTDSHHLNGSPLTESGIDLSCRSKGDTNIDNAIS